MYKCLIGEELIFKPCCASSTAGFTLAKSAITSFVFSAIDASCC